MVVPIRQTNSAIGQTCSAIFNYPKSQSHQNYTLIILDTITCNPLRDQDIVTNNEKPVFYMDPICSKQTDTGLKIWPNLLRFFRKKLGGILKYIYTIENLLKIKFDNPNKYRVYFQLMGHDLDLKFYLRCKVTVRSHTENLLFSHQTCKLTSKNNTTNSMASSQINVPETQPLSFVPPLISNISIVNPKNSATNAISNLSYPSETNTIAIDKTEGYNDNDTTTSNLPTFNSRSILKSQLTTNPKNSVTVTSPYPIMSQTYLVTDPSYLSEKNTIPIDKTEGYNHNDTTTSNLPTFNSRSILKSQLTTNPKNSVTVTSPYPIMSQTYLLTDPSYPSEKNTIPIDKTKGYNDNDNITYSPSIRKVAKSSTNSINQSTILPNYSAKLTAEDLRTVSFNSSVLVVTEKSISDDPISSITRHFFILIGFMMAILFFNEFGIRCLIYMFNVLVILDVIYLIYNVILYIKK